MKATSNIMEPAATMTRNVQKIAEHLEYSYQGHIELRF